jgi:hypothetical protein
MRLYIICLFACITFSIVIQGNTSHLWASASKDKTSIEEVKKETEELLQTLESYLIAQRIEAIQKTEKALNNLDKQIDALETRIDDNWEKMDKSARDKARASLKALRKRRIEVAEWYGRMKSSSVEAWEHMKKGFVDAYQTLYQSWEKSAKEFSSENN